MKIIGVRAANLAHVTRHSISLDEINQMFNNGLIIRRNRKYRTAMYTADGHTYGGRRLRVNFNHDAHRYRDQRLGTVRAMSNKDFPTDPTDYFTEDDLGEPIADVKIQLNQDKPTTVSFRTTLGHAKTFAQYAQQHGLSTSEFIRNAIDAAMANHTVTVNGLSPVTTSHITTTLRTLLDEVTDELRRAS